MRYTIMCVKFYLLKTIKYYRVSVLCRMYVNIMCTINNSIGAPYIVYCKLVCAYDYKVQRCFDELIGSNYYIENENSWSTLTDYFLNHGRNVQHPSISLAQKCGTVMIQLYNTYHAKTTE